MYMKQKLAMLFLVSAAAGTTGCYSTWDLAPQAVVKLDGFRTGQEVPLETTDRSSITYDKDSSLRFANKDGSEVQGQFRAIKIDGSTFMGLDNEKGSKVVVDLQEVKQVEARTYSKGKTAIAATATVLVGLPATAYLLLTIAFLIDPL